MPHYALVVTDSAKDREAEIGRHVRGGQRRQDVERRITQGRPVGSLHALVEDACPDGGTNCRNCGDPAFAESCAAAGHCEACGTRHGIAPEAAVAAAGLALDVVPDAEVPKDGPDGRPDKVWDVARRKFIPRGGPIG